MSVLSNGDSELIGLAPLIGSVEDDLKARYGHEADSIVAAPGRVNLIGEHVDYNDGFVLPLAIEQYVVVAASMTNADTSTVALHSQRLNETRSVRLDQPIQPGQGGWIEYVQGVIAGFKQRGIDIPAFNAVIGSNLSIGGGLSSSAALEVATATLLEHLTGATLDAQEKALLCREAEHQFAGVPCGIMDQFSSVFGRADELMLIDCRSRSIEYVPFETTDICVLIANSNVSHELTGGEYRSRREQCNSALRKLGVGSWRDVGMAKLEQAKVRLTDLEFRRGRHVVSEIDRTTQTVNAMRSRNWDLVGDLMYASHRSLRDDFEVSCAELDLLVQIASDLDRDAGVIGSRMTGGGFGGCTVSLVRQDALDSVISELKQQYESQTGISIEPFACRPADGACVVDRFGRGG